MMLLNAFLVLVAAPCAVIVIGVAWLWLGRKILICMLGR